MLICCHWTLAKVSAHALQEAKEHAEYLGRQMSIPFPSIYPLFTHRCMKRLSSMREQWLNALKELELFEGFHVSRHFLFEALMGALVPVNCC